MPLYSRQVGARVAPQQRTILRLTKTSYLPRSWFVNSKHKKIANEYAEYSFFDSFWKSMSKKLSNFSRNCFFLPFLPSRSTRNGPLPPKTSSTQFLQSMCQTRKPSDRKLHVSDTFLQKFRAWSETAARILPRMKLENRKRSEKNDSTDTIESYNVPDRAA